MSLEQVLQKLKEEYIADFPKKIDQIKELFENKKTEELITVFHQLKGSGRTYGIPEVSLFGQVLEQISRQEIQTIFSYDKQILENFHSIYEYRKKEIVFPVEDSEVYIHLQSLLASK